jgi:hypothetical protein
MEKIDNYFLKEIKELERDIIAYPNVTRIKTELEYFGKIYNIYYRLEYLEYTKLYYNIKVENDFDIIIEIKQKIIDYTIQVINHLRMVNTLLSITDIKIFRSRINDSIKSLMLYIKLIETSISFLSLKHGFKIKDIKHIKKIKKLRQQTF